VQALTADLITEVKGAKGMTHIVGQLPNKHKALNSNPSITKKKKGLNHYSKKSYSGENCVLRIFSL
jgi:hypothetical protein